MNLVKKCTSIFGDINPSRFFVIRTTPGTHDWFIAIDQQTLKPMFESESQKEVEQFAEWNTQVRDLAFIAKNMDDDVSGTVLYAGLDLTVSQDGLPLLPAGAVTGELQITQSDSFDGAAKVLNPDWDQWHQCFENSKVMQFAKRHQCALLEIECEDEYGSHSFMVIINFHHTSGFSMKVLDSDYMRKNSDLPLVKGFYDNLRGIGHRRALISTPVISPEDVEESTAFFPNNFPIYTEHSKGSDELRTNVIVSEGELLIDLAAKRPWMVEKDKHGIALPLRIEKCMYAEDATEDAAERESYFISSVVIMDKITDAVRALQVTEQQAQGLIPGQTMGDGQFKKVAEILGTTLEVLYNKTTPNTLGTRDWFSYRLWVEGELVLDVHPSNEIQYQARVASLGPSFSIDWSDPQPSVEAVAEMLDLALIGVAEGGDEDSLDFLLPKRVQLFLGSSYADELRLAADDLREGKAELVNGIYVELETEDALEEPAP